LEELFSFKRLILKSLGSQVITTELWILKNDVLFFSGYCIITVTIDIIRKALLEIMDGSTSFLRVKLGHIRKPESSL